MGPWDRNVPLLQVLDGYLPMVEPHLDVLIERRRVNITNGVSELVSEVMGDPQATIGFNTRNKMV